MFGGNVLVLHQHLTGLGDGLTDGGHPGKVKVAQLDLPVAGDIDAVGGKVAVDDAFLMTIG